MMDRLPLIGGAYAARSVIAACYRCINLFPEINPEKSTLVPMTHYQRPGLTSLQVAPVPAPGRGIYRASNGAGYCVIGQNVYSIGLNWALTLLGQLEVPGINLVSFIDNGIDILLVDNSTFGYTINLATNAFGLFVDPTGTFQGATKVDYIDTFVIWNMPGTKNWGSTLSNELVIDPTYVAAKTDYPDPLQTLIVNRHEIALIGSLKSEIWYDVGGAQFPFAEYPGVYIEHGTVAPYSVSATDISTFWLAQDLQGQGIVIRKRGYTATRISNHALEYALRQIVANGGTLADAISYCYQQDGHVFYVLTLPSGDQTWVFDDAVAEPNLAWHQRAWTDGDGNLHRERANCHAFINGKNVVLDWQTGELFALDLNNYTDNGSLVSFIRTFPHIGQGRLNSGAPFPFPSGGARIQYKAFMLDLDCGNSPLDAEGNPPVVSLNTSIDRGHSWGNAVPLTMGGPGQYNTFPTWLREGIGRDTVFEVAYSTPGPAALNGAWVDAEILAS